jgi:NADH-quinone oxidoreductase subunit L
VEPVFAAAGTKTHAISLETTVGLAAVATAIAALGIWGLARSWYKTGDNPAPARAAERFRGLYAFVINKYWVDELYIAIFVDFGKWLCHRFWTVDAKGVDGAVNGTSWLTVVLSQVSAKFDFRGVDGLVNAIADLIQGGSNVFRRIQTGVLQNYLLAMAMGIFVIVSLFYFF